MQEIIDQKYDNKLYILVSLTHTGIDTIILTFRENSQII